MAHDSTHDTHSHPEAHGHDGHGHARATDTYFLAPALWTSVRNALAFLALAGWLAMIAGFITNREQFHFSYLVAFVFFVTITLGALFYLMVQHVTGSAWSVTVRRLMENVVRTVPMTLLLFIPVILGIHTTFEWSHASAATDPILKQKLVYLNEPWFIARGIIVIALWSLWAVVLYRSSRAQDETGSLQFTRRLEAWSAPGLLVLFLSASVASYDWSMSVDPHWFSTMFGVYVLAGGGVGFIAVLILVCLGLRSAGYLTNSINEEHYHDLGKWLFAITVFWAYVAFSQYMLIWYGNLPEETFWFLRRTEGTWKGVAMLLVVGHFIFPFFTLLPRASKRSFAMLSFFSGWLLIMHFVDIHWQIMPVLHKHGFSFHWLDFASLVAVGSSYALAFWGGLKERPLVPVGDPRLAQCLNFHNA